MSPEREEAELLLGKAREDQAAVVRFATDDAIADSVIGFHAQQAVEKALKAVLVLAGEEFQWTHDLRYLLELLEKAGVDVPEDVRAARRLTPWAVEFRYGQAVGGELDREQAAALVDEALTWASDR